MTTNFRQSYVPIVVFKISTYLQLPVKSYLATFMHQCLSRQVHSQYVSNFSPMHITLSQIPADFCAFILHKASLKYQGLSVCFRLHIIRILMTFMNIVHIFVFIVIADASSKRHSFDIGHVLYEFSVLTSTDRTFPAVSE